MGRGKRRGQDREGDEEIQTVTFKTSYKGSSPLVQWVGLGAFTAVAWVQSLVRELRSRMP